VFQSLAPRPTGLASTLSRPASPPRRLVSEEPPDVRPAGLSLAAAERFGHQFGRYPLVAPERAPIQRGRHKRKSDRKDDEPTKKRKIEKGDEDSDDEKKVKKKKGKKKDDRRSKKRKHKGDDKDDPKKRKLATGLDLPSRPKFRNEEVEVRKNTKLLQPLSFLDPQPVEKGPRLSGADLEERLKDVKSTDPEDPIKVDTTRLRQFTKVPIKKLDLALSGANQGGLSPEKEKYRTELPEFSDYTQSRPQQILSQLGEVFLHHGVQAKKKPVEVQFGYGLKEDKSLDLFASSNNLASQKWLAKALKTPVEHLKEAAKSPDGHISQVAQKLLFFDQQNEKRREKIKGKPNEEELEKQIQLAEKIHRAFLGGPVRVATNTAMRHAEQNIADVIHGGYINPKGKRSDYVQADIQGPKIRCEGCSSELGPSLIDKSGKNVIGKVYASQSKKEKHEKTFEDIRRGRTRVATNRSERPHSTSPVRIRPKPNPKLKPVVDVKKKRRRTTRR